MKFGGFGFDRLLALIDIMVAAWRAKKSIGTFFKSHTTNSVFTNNLLAVRWLAANPVLAQKNCPHCAEPTPISSLFCDACDYNFLSGSLGTRQKSLPSPSSTKRQVSKPHLVSSRL